MARQLVILGTSVTLPDPGSVDDLAAQFQEQSEQLAELETTLQGLARPDAWGGWTGLAADAFGRSIGQLPAELGDARDAYEEVASALRQYAGQLWSVVGSISSLSLPADDAEGLLAATEKARAQAILHGQVAAIPAWDLRVADAEAAVAELRRRLNGLLTELNALAATCTRQIKAAEPTTAHKSLFGELESDYTRDIADPVGHGAVKVGKAVLGAGKATEHLLDDTFVKPFSDLRTDLVKLYRDPDLHTMGAVLQDVGDAVGVVALALTVVAAAALFVVASVGTGGAADAIVAGALVGLEAADDLSLVGMAAHIDALGFNTGAVVTHENDASWSQVSNSALSVAADAAGNGIGDHASLGVSSAFDAGSGLEVTAFNNGITHELSVPAAAPDARDVSSGLDASADSVQSLQGLPVNPVNPVQAAGGGGILQPAVSVPSPAVVNIQHVALSPQPGVPGSGVSGLGGNW